MKGRGHLRDVSLGGGIILKCILKALRSWKVDWIQLVQGRVQ